MPKFTSETGREAGRKGGPVSGKKKQEQKNAREAAAMLMHMAATGSVKQAITKLGYEENEQTYLNGLMVKLYLMAMDGDLEALDRLMKYSGYDPEENRKEAESVAQIKQKNVELQIRIKELELKMQAANGVDLDAEESTDVMIYLPAVETENDIDALNEEYESQFGEPKNEEDELEVVAIQMPAEVNTEA